MKRVAPPLTSQPGHKDNTNEDVNEEVAIPPEKAPPIPLVAVPAASANTFVMRLRFHFLFLFKYIYKKNPIYSSWRTGAEMGRNCQKRICATTSRLFEEKQEREKQPKGKAYFTVKSYVTTIVHTGFSPESLERITHSKQGWSVDPSLEMTDPGDNAKFTSEFLQ